jgi:hypothetical protein
MMCAENQRNPEILERDGLLGFPGLGLTLGQAVA